MTPMSIALLVLVIITAPAAFYGGYRYGLSRAYDDILDTLREFEETE